MTEPIFRFQPLWGNWSVERLLGVGSFGKVWEVSQGTRRAAVKEIVVPPIGTDLRDAQMQGLDSDGAKEYFHSAMEAMLDEIYLMKALAECENIVQIKDFLVGELDGQGEFGWVILILMERLIPFQTCWREGLSVQDVARLGIDLSNALESCCYKGILHRDVKPDNVFFDSESGNYKLGDFGVSHYLARPTAGKGRAGTLTHMSPEVYQGAPFTAASDLYALGMMLYYLLNDNRIPLLPLYPKPYTPLDRDQALVRRLHGEEINTPSIVRYAYESGILLTGLGARFDERSRGFAAILGKIAQKAIAATPEARFTSAADLRLTIQNAIITAT